MVTCDHNPLDVELKKVEFDRATPGTIGLESAFGAINTVFPTKTSVKLLTKGKERFGFDSVSVNIGNKPNITLFNPDAKYIFSTSDIYSKSKNSILRKQN